MRLLSAPVPTGRAAVDEEIPRGDPALLHGSVVKWQGPGTSLREESLGLFPVARWLEDYFIFAFGAPPAWSRWTS